MRSHMHAIVHATQPQPIAQLSQAVRQCDVVSRLDIRVNHVSQLQPTTQLHMVKHILQVQVSTPQVERVGYLQLHLM